ncbi:MAG: hypothetical protein RLZZ393_608, partial [Pseudomonadota bacterium]
MHMLRRIVGLSLFLHCALPVLAAEPPPSRLWTDAQGHLTQAAEALREEMLQARRRGLDPLDYELPVPVAGVDPADFERRFSQAVARFVTHLERGHVAPQEAGHALPPRRAALDAASTLRALARAGDVAALLDAHEPRYRHFVLLKQALARYRRLAEAGPDVPLPKLPSRRVAAGEPYADAGLLRQRLVQLGDLETASAAGQDGFDAGLADALSRFQARHGLAADGVLGASTWRELNVPLARRVRQIELAMERVRWLPPPPDGPFIVVNIPQFRLYAFKGPGDSEQAMTAMNVIVGRTFPRFRTPVFSADIRQVVFRPYWDVPANILRNELLPDLRRDLRIAEREGY